jgi:hypothetical protein
MRAERSQGLSNLPTSDPGSMVDVANACCSSFVISMSKHDQGQNGSERILHSQLLGHPTKIRDTQASELDGSTYLNLVDVIRPTLGIKST